MALETRRQIHKLSQMYSIINNYSPVYLQNIIVHLILDNRQNTRLQTHNNLIVCKYNPSIYQESFINSTALDCNSLANDIKNSPSLFTLKVRLMGLFSCKALLVNHDIVRNNQVAFMQIWMGFTHLNPDLFSKACINDRTCSCSSGGKDTRYYSPKCPNWVTCK